MKFFQKREIRAPDGDVYMRRTTLFECFWFSIKFHTIIKGDWARDLHDHPWSFVTFIIWPGYGEETLLGHHWRKPLRFYYRPSTWRHRVTTNRPVYTIVFTGPKHREWGFWTNDGFVHWESYCASGEFDYPKEDQHELQ